MSLRAAFISPGRVPCIGARNWKNRWVSLVNVAKNRSKPVRSMSTGKNVLQRRDVAYAVVCRASAIGAPWLLLPFFYRGSVIPTGLSILSRGSGGG